MRVTVLPGAARGAVSMIPSKSQLHRMLICAALSDRETQLYCQETDAEDIVATASCLRALGAEIEPHEKGISVRPLDRNHLKSVCTLPCKESGSTLRFLLPVICALGVTGEFHMEGRLPERPLSPLDEELKRQGCTFSRPKPNILRVEGQLRPGDFCLPGNVSSQYISGLLFALPLLEGDSRLRVTGPIESADYIAMTLEAERRFGMTFPMEGDSYRIPGKGAFVSPGEITVEGDWSNAAFWLCAGALPKGNVELYNLNRDSLQGDKKVWSILEEMGAKVTWEKGRLLLSEGKRQAVEIDAAAIPDLIPAMAAVCAVSPGETRIINAGRLRIKESDRLTSVAQTLHALGARITEEPEGLLIHGVTALKGGKVSAWGDHRIAMMAAIASCASEEAVTIEGAQAVNKSYPSFWSVLRAMGKTVLTEEE